MEVIVDYIIRRRRGEASHERPPRPILPQRAVARGFFRLLQEAEVVVPFRTAVPKFESPEQLEEDVIIVPAALKSDASTLGRGSPFEESRLAAIQQWAEHHLASPFIDLRSYDNDERRAWFLRFGEFEQASRDRSMMWFEDEARVVRESMSDIEIDVPTKSLAGFSVGDLFAVTNAQNGYSLSAIWRSVSAATELSTQPSVSRLRGEVFRRFSPPLARENYGRYLSGALGGNHGSGTNGL